MLAREQGFARARRVRPRSAGSVSAVMTLVLAVASGLPGLAAPALGAPGDRDATFGVGGLVVEGGAKSLGASAIAVQADGKLVVAGWAGQTEQPFRVDPLLMRLDADGSLDPAFGDAGLVIAPGNDPEWATALAIDAQGRLVVALYSPAEFVAARFLDDGSLDPAFGAAGVARVPIVPRACQAACYKSGTRSVAVDDAGRILLGGEVADPGVGATALAVARLDPDGMVDASFGSAGLATALAPAAIDAEDLGVAVAVDSKGRVVTAGTREIGGFEMGPVVARFDATGRPDESFDGDGLSLVPLAGGSARGMALTSDDRLVLVGDAASSGTPLVRGDALLVRLRSDGRLDRSFDADGRRTAGLAGEATTALGRAVAVQDDNRILLAATTIHGIGSPCLHQVRTVVTRFAVNGDRETTFTVQPAAFEADADAAMIDAEGRLVVAGTTPISCVQRRAAIKVARYEADPPPMPGCRYSVRPVLSRAGAGESVGTDESVLDVAAGPDCPWYVASNSPWITLPGGGGGVGSGTVRIARSANRGRVGRLATLEIRDGSPRARAQARLYQPACSFTIDPTHVLVAASAGIGEIAVHGGAGCLWTAAEDADWLFIDPPAGLGDGTIRYFAGSNLGPQRRSARVNVGGRFFTVVQRAAGEP